MRKKMTRMAAIAMAAAMTVATPVAAAGSGTTFSGTTSGTQAHIFYKEDITTVVVPTALTVAFNPGGFTVDAGNGEKITDQIVSKSVAMVSEAVKDYKVGVSFAVSASDGSNIKFVTDEDDVNKGTDLNVLLQLAASTGDTIKVYSAAGSGTDEKAITVSNGTLAVSAEQLSRAKMTVSSATGGVVPLGSGATADFLLGKANYDYEDIVLDGYSGTNVISGTLAGIGQTSGTTLENKTYTGVAGFKFTGKLNQYADWSKVGKDAKITINPTYNFKDLEVNTKNQITENVLTGTGSFLGIAKTAYVTKGSTIEISKSSTEKFTEKESKPQVLRIGGIDMKDSYEIEANDEDGTTDSFKIDTETFETRYKALVGLTEDDAMPKGTYNVVVVIDGISYSGVITY